MGVKDPRTHRAFHQFNADGVAYEFGTLRASPGESSPCPPLLWAADVAIRIRAALDIIHQDGALQRDRGWEEYTTITHSSR